MGSLFLDIFAFPLAISFAMLVLAVIYVELRVLPRLRKLERAATPGAAEPALREAPAKSA